MLTAVSTPTYFDQIHISFTVRVIFISLDSKLTIHQTVIAGKKKGKYMSKMHDYMQYLILTTHPNLVDTKSIAGVLEADSPDVKCRESRHLNRYRHQGREYHGKRQEKQAKFETYRFAHYSYRLVVPAVVRGELEAKAVVDQVLHRSSLCRREFPLWPAKYWDAITTSGQRSGPGEEDKRDRPYSKHPNVETGTGRWQSW